LKAAIREVADKMEGMGDKFLSFKQMETRKSTFSKELYLAVLLIVSTYILLYGDTFFWVGLIGFVCSVLIALLIMIQNR
jgi:ubiquinone biosynthesis protein